MDALRFQFAINMSKIQQQQPEEEIKEQPVFPSRDLKRRDPPQIIEECVDEKSQEHSISKVMPEDIEVSIPVYDLDREEEKFSEQQFDQN